MPASPHARQSKPTFLPEHIHSLSPHMRVYQFFRWSRSFSADLSSPGFGQLQRRITTNARAL
jgi:hypothetical protein